MNRERLQAIVFGLALTALVAAPIYYATQPPLEAPRDHVAAPVERPAETGRLAPLVSLNDFKGQPWRLADLRDKKAALMVFWASW